MSDDDFSGNVIIGEEEVDNTTVETIHPLNQYWRACSACIESGLGLDSHHVPNEIIADRLTYLVEKGVISFDASVMLLSFLSKRPCLLLLQFESEAETGITDRDIQSLYETLDLNIPVIKEDQLKTYASLFIDEIKKKILERQSPSMNEIRAMVIQSYGNDACTVPRDILNELLWAIYYLRVDVIDFFINPKIPLNSDPTEEQ